MCQRTSELCLLVIKLISKVVTAFIYQKKKVAVFTTFFTYVRKHLKKHMYISGMVSQQTNVYLCLGLGNWGIWHLIALLACNIHCYVHRLWILFLLSLLMVCYWYSITIIAFILLCLNFKGRQNSFLWMTLKVLKISGQSFTTEVMG